MKPRVGLQLALLFVAAFVGGLIVLVWIRRDLWWLLPIYGVMSLISALAYAMDKNRAAGGGWRIPEKYLHMLDTLGGWPGGLIAHHLFRHKNRKFDYQFVFWVFVVAHLIGLAYLALH